MITPIVVKGLATPRYWLYWIGHTQTVLVAIYFLEVNRFRPRWPDFRNMLRLSVAGLIFVIGVNTALGSNYAYLGDDKPGRRTVIDFLGPWPMRMIPLIIIGFSILGFMFWISTFLRRRNEARSLALKGAASD